MEIRILLLGTVALRAGGEHRPLGTPKERLALAALAWDAGRAVSLDTLVHRVWDEQPPSKPLDALYVHIHRIRKALSGLGDAGGLAVNSRAHTYTLRIDPDAVDLRRYASLVDRGRALADAGSDREALSALHEAHALWGGEPLAGLPGSWAAHLRDVMGEKYLAASLLTADLLLRKGSCAEAVAALQPLADRYWAHQPFAGRLALALHGCGRTDEASRLLQRTLRHLLRTSGTEPGEELRHVHQGILAGTPVAALLPVPPAGAPGGPTAGPAPDTLPLDAPWVGRRDELARLTEVLAGNEAAGASAAAITGMPGAGKSALAVHAVYRLRHHFPAGRLFLDLRGHNPRQPPMGPTEALRELLRLLGTPPSALPESLDGLVPLWRTAARSRRFAVVLDDALTADQVAPLLVGNASARVLVTSRHRMAHLPGVRHIALDVLSRPDAVGLLQRILGEEQAPDPGEAATLARLCGDLPLALTLIARRLLSRPSWGVRDLVERFARVHRRLPEIRDRNSAMADALEVSYQSLDPAEQHVFRRLGLHIGSEFGPEAVSALAGLPLDETEFVLEELQNCHLVTEPAPHRYRLHDLLREYAATLAERAPEADGRAALDRLLRHYLHTADQADRRAYAHRLRIDLPGGAPAADWPDADPQQWFTVEGPNLLAALEHTRSHGTPLQLALYTHTLAGFLTSEGYLSTATPLLKQAVAHWRKSGDRAAYGRALIDLAGACAGAGAYDEALHSSRQALESGRAAVDTALEAEALHQMSITYWHTARHTEALELQQRALRLRQETPNRLQQARSLNMLGMLSLRLDRHKDALKYFLEGRARFRDVGDRRGQFVALHNLAELYKEAGNLENAIGAYQQALKLSRALGSKGQHAILQMNLADSLRACGKTEEALALFDMALPTLRSAGDRRSEAIARMGIGRALSAAGRSEESLPHHAAALALARTIRAALEECQALRALGEAEAATGREAQARAHLAAGLALSREIEAPSEEAETRRALAQTYGDKATLRNV